MKVYHGERTERGCKVTVDGAPLRLRSDLSGNAYTAFDWGYVGNGQLSVALLSDFLGDDPKAKALCEAFDNEVVANLPKAGWSRTDGDFAAALAPLLDADGNRAFARDEDGVAAFGDMPVETTTIALDAPGANDAGAAHSKASAQPLKETKNSHEDAAAHVLNKAADEAVHTANRANDAATAVTQSHQAVRARDQLADEAMSTLNRAADEKAYAANRAADEAAILAHQAVDAARRVPG